MFADDAVGPGVGPEANRGHQKILDALLVIVALGESVVAIGMGVDTEHLTAGAFGARALAGGVALFLRADSVERAPGKACSSSPRPSTSASTGLTPGRPTPRSRDARVGSVSTSTGGRTRVAVLDDYQGVALAMADWSPVTTHADVDVFSDHLADVDALIERLAPYDVVVLMRERTPFPAEVISRLPALRLLVTTGARNNSIDLDAARAQGVVVSGTGSLATAPAELSGAPADRLRDLRNQLRAHLNVGRCCGGG
jgi:hypothetical protein